MEPIHESILWIGSVFIQIATKGNFAGYIADWPEEKWQKKNYLPLYLKGIPLKTALYMRMPSKQKVIVILLLFVFSTIRAQSVRQITVDDGLSQGFVSDLAVDPEGFIWMGTLNGLNRYDGHRFRVWRTNQSDTGALKSNEIRRVVFDNSGNLWVATTSGIQIMDRRTGRFYSSPDLSKTSSKRFTNAVFDVQNRLWLVYRDTIYVFSAGYEMERIRDWGTRISNLRKIPMSLSTYGSIRCLESHGDQIIVGTDRGVFRISVSDFSVRTYTVLPRYEKVSWLWNESSKNRLWIRAGREVYMLDGSGEARIFESEVFDNQVINLGVSAGDKTYLISGAKVFEFNSETIRELPFEFPEQIISAAPDHTGNVWLGTNAKGLRMLQPESFVFAQYLNGVSLNRSLLVDRDGNVIFSGRMGLVWNANKGYQVLSPQTGKVIGNFIDYPHSFVAKGNADDFWACGIAGMLYHVTRDHKIDRQVQMHSISPGTEVRSLYVDKQGNVLLLFNAWEVKGINPVTGKEFTIDLKPWGENPEDPRINAKLARSDGSIWLGTQLGLFCLKKKPGSAEYICLKQAEIPGNREGLAGLKVYALSEDPSLPDVIWVGTEQGLYRLDLSTGAVRCFDMRSGFPDDVIYSLVSVGDRYLWMGTNHGLLKFRTDNFDVFQFTSAHGLPASEFNNNVATLGPDGRLWFGSVNGLTGFYPDKIVLPSQRPVARFSGIHFIKEINSSGKNAIEGLEQDLILDQTVQIPYGQNAFILDFSLMDYYDPKNNNYRYRILGKKSEWIPLGTSHTLSFAGLQPGDYTIEMQGRTNIGPWSDSAFLSFVILPPWWRSWWAYGIYAILFLFITSGTWYLRFRSLYWQRQAELEHAHLERQNKLETYRTRLFANISHEIRTPLTIIIGFLTEARQKMPEEMRRQLEAILRSGKELMGMADQMLDLSKAEQDNLVLHPETNDLGAFLALVAEPFQFLAAQKNIHFKVDMPEKAVLVDFDERYLRPVVNNLLSNAMKFTPFGGTVLLHAKSDSEMVSITVEDSGVGVSPENLEHIFDRFFQSQDAGLQQGGAGIGLAYVQEVVQRMNGRVDVQSVLGKGSTFTVWLPWSAKNVVHPRVVATGAEEPELVDSVSGKSPKSGRQIILIVEDNAEVARFIGSAFQEGYAIYFAKNGREGLEMALKLIPDVIFSDVIMPVMDGLEMCVSLKQDFRTSHIPIVLLSARTGESDMLEGLRCGAEVYLTKPFSKEVLQLTVKNQMEAQSRWRSRYDGALEQLQNVPEPEKSQESREDIFVQQVLSIIGERYMDASFGVPDLLRTLSVSNSQLHRKLTTLTGYSAGHFIRQYRLQQAKKLLQEQPDWSVNQIAYETGFGDPNYFSRAFSNEFGCSPKIYRQTLKKT